MGNYTNITDFIFSFFYNLMSMFEQLKTFLFTQITIFGYSFQVWTLITGGLFITFLVSWLIGKITGWGWFS